MVWFQDIEFEDFKVFMEVNCEGVFLGFKYVGKVMIENGGGFIVNILFVVGIIGVVNFFVYGVFKWVVCGMIKFVVFEYVWYNICVNFIYFGFIDIDMMCDVGDEECFNCMLKIVFMCCVV